MLDSPSSASREQARDRFAKAAADLEWASMLELVAAECSGAVAAERVRRQLPAADFSEARRRLALTAEAMAAGAEGEPVPQRAVPDVAAVLARVALGGSSDGPELAAVAEVLVAARAVRVFVTERRERFPDLAQELGSSPALDVLSASLAAALDDGGRVTDGASSALAAARRRVRSLREDLLAELRRLARQHADVLRDERPVERDGRLGLAVRSDAHRPVHGIVLGSSASGATLFVEPPSATDLANRLRVAEAEVLREEARVLAELSDELRQRLEETRAAFDACLRADVLGAVVRWAARCRARMVPIDEERRIDLVGVRHPLLAAKLGHVVANDVAVRSGSALVISGPNAGGKTVALKCLGLSVWMVRAGFPLCVEAGSRVGWYDRVLTDIGDQQSLERSLSTFSAEIENLVAILAVANERSLVLLDEVAGATDPEEGTALAAAVLEALVEQGAAVAATTHYDRLKELAAGEGELVNASVGFDFDRMQPTFELSMGVPGASSALAVAARHGMDGRIIARAKELMPAPARIREELIRELGRERRVLADARAQAEVAAGEAQRLKGELEVERRDVRDKERRKLERETADLVARVRRARAELRAVADELKEPPRAEALREAERRVDGVAKLVALRGPLERATKGDTIGTALASEEVRVGARVFVERLGADAEIVELSGRGHVKVRSGPFATRVPVAELQAPRRRPRERRPEPLARSATRAPRSEASGDEIRTSDNTCDLRGQRVDEGLEALERFIDAMLSKSEPVGFVLHGHGTGALRNAVREHLALSSHVSVVRPANSGEGGDAFTMFRLR